MTTSSPMATNAPIVTLLLIEAVGEIQASGEMPRGNAGVSNQRATTFANAAWGLETRMKRGSLPSVSFGTRTAPAFVVRSWGGYRGLPIKLMVSEVTTCSGDTPQVR